MCCMWLTENTGRKKSPSRHHCTSLSGHIFATKACIDNRKKNLLNSNVSPTSHNIVNFSPLAAEICWRAWGTPANFNGFCVLAVLLHCTLVVGVSQSLRRWTEGATYIRQGGHHVGHWRTFWLLIIVAIFPVLSSVIFNVIAMYFLIWQMMQKLLSSLTYDIFLLRYGDLPLPRHMMFEQGVCDKHYLTSFTLVVMYIEIY